MTSQEAFAQMMKQEVAPALRRLGFKGSGQRYELPSETHWAVVGFQKFTWSNQDSVEFTLNVTVVSRDDWLRAREGKPHLGERPSANTRGGVGWEARIGDLVPRGTEGDYSWIVSAGRSTEPVAGEVVSAIADHVIPAMRERIALG